MDLRNEPSLIESYKKVHAKGAVSQFQDSSDIAADKKWQLMEMIYKMDAI
jgi:hypothetical protein